jgi:hypothetical protein
VYGVGAPGGVFEIEIVADPESTDELGIRGLGGSDIQTPAVNTNDPKIPVNILPALPVVPEFQHQTA